MGWSVAWEYQIRMAAGASVDDICTARRRTIEAEMTRQYEARQAEKRGRRALILALYVDHLVKGGHLTEWPAQRACGPRSAA